MENTNTKYGVMTRALGKFCHGCGICPYAARKSESRFNKAMEWHATWCPGRSAHLMMYGQKLGVAPVYKTSPSHPA